MGIKIPENGVDLEKTNYNNIMDINTLLSAHNSQHQLLHLLIEKNGHPTFLVVDTKDVIDLDLAHNRVKVPEGEFKIKSLTAHCTCCPATKESVKKETHYFIKVFSAKEEDTLRYLRYHLVLSFYEMIASEPLIMGFVGLKQKENAPIGPDLKRLMLDAYDFTNQTLQAEGIKIGMEKSEVEELLNNKSISAIKGLYVECCNSLGIDI